MNPSWMSLKLIDSYIKRHEHYLAQAIAKTQIPAVQIRNAINYALFPGGKRLRPLLVYLTGELLGINLNTLDVIAAAVELTHCYSLIHDDLPAMDNDDLRRGKPSCHRAFDEATAILVGDGMQVLALELLLTELSPLLKSRHIVAIARELTKASGISGMVSGQSLDLSELSGVLINEAALREIHQLKTEKLISSCFNMVLAALDPAPSLEIAQALNTYASHIGLVFQIQDDYLDYYAAEDTLGKGRSSDRANEKTTFATLFSKEQLEEQIAHHYQIAFASLALFGANARNLIDLTQQLQERSRISPKA